VQPLNKEDGLVAMLADAEFYYLAVEIISILLVILTVKRQARTVAPKPIQKGKP